MSESIELILEQLDELEEQEQHIKEANFEIERLKKDNEYLNQVNIELSTEKNRLNNLLKETSQILSEQTTKAITLKSENERLNNIINEFDKLIKNEINESKLEDNYERVDSLEYCLATLKELKADIEEYRDSTTWWSNRFNAVERNNRELMQEIERLKNDIKRITEITNQKIKIINDVRELIKRDLSTDKANNLIYSELLDIIGEENK